MLQNTNTYVIMISGDQLTLRDSTKAKGVS